jgi:hypothetical protein
MNITLVKTSPFFICMWFATVPCIGHAQGNYAPLITSPGTGVLFSGNSVTVGCVFTVGFSPVTIAALGLFDSGSAGMAQAPSVGLWTIDGSLLESVSFQPGTSGISLNGFLYQSVTTQYVLPVGTTWVLGAYYPSGTSDLCHANDSGQTESWSSSVAHFITCRYTADGVGFTFPTLQAQGMSYVGPNILYAVPEPSTLSLLLWSGLGCTFWHVRRNKSLSHEDAA